MRILYHHRTLGDGAEGVHIREMVAAFRALGHEVVMHALAEPRGGGGGGPTLATRVKAHLPQGLFEAVAMAYNVADAVGVARAVRRHRPDLLYKRHALFDVGAILAAPLLRVPVVLEVNAAYSSATYQTLERIRFGRLAALFERLAVQTASVVAAVSTPLRDRLAALVSRADHVIVVPNGANPERFSPGIEGAAELRAAVGPEAGVVVGWSGILREWHGMELLFAAVARTPGVRLVIIGDGPDRARAERAARELGVDGRTVFTGRVPYARMPAYVAGLDVGVAADDRTGFASPMKVLEYMAAGLAVVAPRLPGVQDIIEDEVTGLLFTPGSAEALSDALARLARDAQLRRDLGRRARRLVERERNWRRNAETVLQALGSAYVHQPTAG